MSYVLATIPNILEGAGLNRASILTALIIFIIICSVAMALYTNRPFALAPGLSSVAIIGTTLPQMNMPVEVAFGLVFLSGVIFVIISFVGIREIVVKAIPASVKISISAGIGLYISLIGLKMAGVVIANPKNNTLISTRSKENKGKSNFSNINGNYYWNSYGSNKSTDKFS